MSIENDIKAVKHIIDGYQELFDGIGGMIIDKEAMGEETNADLAEQARIAARLAHYQSVHANLKGAAQRPSSPSAEDVAAIADMLQEVKNAATADALIDAGIDAAESILKDMIAKAGNPGGG